MENMTDLIFLYLLSEWKFDNSNTRELWSLLSQEDRKTFWVSFEEFEWKSYIKCMVYGIRKYILHEDLSNMTRALSKNRRYILRYLISYLCFDTCIYKYFINCYLYYLFQVILVASVMHFLYYIHRISSILDCCDIILIDLSNLIINNNNLILICYSFLRKTSFWKIYCFLIENCTYL